VEGEVVGSKSSFHLQHKTHPSACVTDQSEKNEEHVPST